MTHPVRERLKNSGVKFSERMGFWNETPNISYWDVIKSIWSKTTPPRLLKSITRTSPPTTLEGVVFKPADRSNSALYSKFISTNFPTKLVLPPEVISEGLSKNRWIGIEARDTSLNLIGLVISKPISYFYSGEFPQDPLTGVGLVDYFCIAPAWRKKGVGTTLLFKLHVLTRSQGRTPHIFASEGYFIFNKIPVMVKDTYMWRERYHIMGVPDHLVERNITFTEDFLAQIQKGVGGKNFFAVNFGVKTDISHYSSDGYHILIKPTYELKDGLHPVGEILAFWSDFDFDITKIEKSLFDILLDCVNEFDIFIGPNEFPRHRPWTKGASFGFFPFHFHPGTFDVKSLILLI